MLPLWQDCSRVLERELTPQQFSAWIKPLRALDYDASSGRLRIGAPNRFKLDAIRAQFAARIQAAATGVMQRPVDVVFEVENGSAEAPPPEAAPAGSPGTAAAAVHTGGAEPTQRAGNGPAGGVSETFERARLNAALTFDSFVTGKANQLARAAAMQVAENPGGSYNPLFLYGGVGLGKTHLVHAVGNAILTRKPDARVRYIHAEQYVSDVVRAYQRKAFDDFKRYYHSLDLLLIDDIQFFGGKSRTQEEFFYAFEALVAGRKQIIITSDTYPKELKDIEDRLVSRFASGLRGLLHRQEPAQQRARAGRRPAQGAGLRAVSCAHHQHGASARGAQGSAGCVHRPGDGRADPEDRGRPLQDQGRRHVLQAAAQQHRHAAPGRDVPGQGADAEEPARDRRAVRRARPHHRAARGTQDRQGTAHGQRAEPCSARAGATAARPATCPFAPQAAAALCARLPTGFAASQVLEPPALVAAVPRKSPLY